MMWEPTTTFLLIGGDIFSGHKVVTLAYVKVMSHHSSKSFTTTKLIDHRKSAFSHHYYYFHLFQISQFGFRFRFSEKIIKIKNNFIVFHNSV